MGCSQLLNKAQIILCSYRKLSLQATSSNQLVTDVAMHVNLHWDQVTAAYARTHCVPIFNLDFRIFMRHMKMTHCDKEIVVWRHLKS